VVEALKRAGDRQSQVHYIPVHQQPDDVQRYGPLNLPGAQTWNDAA
jgi:dTDP-4-amino-4,6-dideoxygalactose transaminase